MTMMPYKLLIDYARRGDILGLDAFDLQVAYALTGSALVLKTFRARHPRESITLTPEDKTYLRGQGFPIR